MPNVNATGIVCRAPWGGILFLKRSDGYFYGHWCLPGGGIDDGETPERAAHRELLEETGYYLSGDMQELHTAENGFVTHLAHVPDTFTPTLNGEHSEYVWAFPDNPPAPLHPGVRDMLAATDPAAWEPPVAAAMDEMLAFDRAGIRLDERDPLPAFDFKSVRSVDHDGRLHVEVANISKANVCPYLGSEIPGWESLGLDPEQVYQLYRDPEELAKAVSTFNNIPILSEHVQVDAANHRPELVIGSTGTDAVFEAPYLRNSLVFWADGEIKAIEDGSKRELSSSYYYTPDMTPGEVDGVRFDGVMRDIKANHVAKVPEGRAGPDVAVGDSRKEMETMPHSAKLSRMAVATRGAIVAYLAPKLAADAKIDLTATLAPVTRKNFAAQKSAIVTGVKSATAGRLAADADIEDLAQLLDVLDDAEVVATDEDDDDDDMDAAAKLAGDSDGIEGAKAWLKDKLSPEDYAQFEGMLTSPDQAAAADSDDDGDKPKPIDQATMDSAIAAAVQANDKRHADIRAAREEVRPYVGELAAAFDSGSAVRRHALKALGVSDADTIHESALSAVLRAQPKPGAGPRPVTLASDAAASSSFDDQFPGAARIRR